MGPSDFEKIATILADAEKERNDMFQELASKLDAVLEALDAVKSEMLIWEKE